MAELPKNKQLTDLLQLEGHTVLAVFEQPTGKSGHVEADVVIVTETGCWLAAFAERGYDDEATIEVLPEKYGDQWTLHDIVGANSLFTHGVINSGEHQLLLQVEKGIDDARKAERVERLRKQLAEAEKS